MPKMTAYGEGQAFAAKIFACLHSVTSLFSSAGTDEIAGSLVEKVRTEVVLLQ